MWQGSLTSRGLEIPQLTDRTVSTDAVQSAESCRRSSTGLFLFDVGLGSEVKQIDGRSASEVQPHSLKKQSGFTTCQWLENLKDLSMERHPMAVLAKALECPEQGESAPSVTSEW